MTSPRGIPDWNRLSPTIARRTRLFIALALVALSGHELVTAQSIEPQTNPLDPGPSASSQPVDRIIDSFLLRYVVVPQGHLDRPEGLWILPVLLVPSDGGHLAPDPESPGFDFNGNLWDADCRFSPGESCAASRYEATRNNFGVHLQMARWKYRQMLSHPTTGAPRGTFRVAGWDHSRRVGRGVPAYSSGIEPLVLQSPLTQAEILRIYSQDRYDFARPILEAVGCKQTSCPYVFAIATPGLAVAGGRKLNVGYNNGGGLLFFDWTDVERSHDDSQSGPTFQSTLLHEIGHGLGLPHIFDYCDQAGSTEPFDCVLRYDQGFSLSIMGYNSGNWIRGCPETKPAPLETHCVFPDDPAVIDAFPGILLPEDLRVLGKNDLGIPGFTFEEALDAPGAEIFALSAQGQTAIPGIARFELASTDSRAGVSQEPNALVGGHSESFKQFFEPNDPRIIWNAADHDPYDRVSISIDFPEPVSLSLPQGLLRMQRFRWVGRSLRCGERSAPSRRDGSDPRRERLALGRERGPDRRPGAGAAVHTGGPHRRLRLRRFARDSLLLTARRGRDRALPASRAGRIDPVRQRIRRLARARARLGPDRQPGRGPVPRGHLLALGRRPPR